MLRKPFYGRLFFTPETGDGGGGNPPAGGSATTSTTATPPKTEETGEVTFTEAQQREVNRLVGKARTEGRTAAEQAAQAASDAAAAEAQRTADANKGNYEAAKASLEAERDGFKTERDTLAGKVSQYEALAAKQVAALKGDLPAEALEDFPAEGEPVEQWAWLEARAALVAKLAPAGQGQHPRVPATPKSDSAARNAVQEATERMRGKISI